ncbi:uncharacterized protein LOC115746388 [Rhodamnia argentea]|uniref:Uncharacterized protein LOC115746388 n=1 Tax=Rhodamnia argentea TaxID=178133 RepID=A0A8B8PT93_9MYRT|nr:uncharacterized protein LOC115746388 [Rhodamnia argentea]
MLLLSQAPTGALSSKSCCSTSSASSSSSIAFTTPRPPLFSNRKPNFFSRTHPSKPSRLALVRADDGLDAVPPATKQPTLAPPPPFDGGDTVFVGQERVPLEGVIQFEKPSSASRLKKWGRVALLVGGDVAALLLFTAIGRFSHGFPVFDLETLRTADPFVAGWFLGAYFLGGYAGDGRGENGLSKAVLSTTKSWTLGIPLGIAIRAVLSGHVPPYSFILVTMGSTAVLLIGWRMLLFSVLPNDTSKKSDVYKRGSPFELFELLTSLVRRW